MTAAPDLRTRFPALTRLTHRVGGRTIPVVQQLQWADCGAACLSMVLGYHGRRTRLEDLRQRLGSGTRGVDAGELLRGAESFGMRGRGLKVDLEDLRHLPRASILHWEFNHFVVFDRVTRKGVEIIDPAHGRRRVPMSRFSRSFTGVALVVEPTDAFQPAKGDASRAWNYLRQLFGQRHLLARVVTTSLILRLLALGLPLVTALLVDRVLPRGDIDLLTVVGIGLAGIFAFHFLSSLIRSHLLLQLRSNLDIELSLGFLDHLVDLPYAFFQQRSAGDLMLRVASNATIRELLTSSTLSGLLDGSLAFVYLALITAVSPLLGGVVLVLGMLQVTAFLVSKRMIRDLMSRDLEAQARAQGYLAQLLAGIESLKVAGAERGGVQRWSNLFVDELNVSLARGRLRAVIDAVVGILSFGSPLVFLCIGATSVMSGELSLGTMLGLAALATGFLVPLSSLVQSALKLQQLGSYVERIDDVLSAERERTGPAGRTAPALSGAVSLRNVSFSYTPTAPLVLRDVSVEIAAGSSVAIVGRSGSGKSTLAGLLLGLYEPTRGTLAYDEHDLAELDLRGVRRQFGVVPQHPYVFGGTVRDNVTMGDESIPFGRVRAASRAAQILGDVLSWPMGFDTIIADGGASLSGGQRQRIAIARALVKQPSLLLLDEATSCLDAVTERAVMSNVEIQRCTRIIIAHRLSTIIDADEILVMDQGQLVERGTHDELLARGGIYHELVDAQLGRSRPAPAPTTREVAR